MPESITQADALELVNEEYSTDRREEIAQVIDEEWRPGMSPNELADLADCTRGLVETVLLHHFAAVETEGEGGEGEDAGREGRGEAEESPPRSVGDVRREGSPEAVEYQAVPSDFDPEMDPGEAYRTGWRDGFDAGYQMGSRVSEEVRRQQE